MKSKYQQLLEYIKNNDILKSKEFKNYANINSIDNTISSYINILHKSYLLERIDAGVYKKSDIFFNISLKELNIIYKKMRNESFRIKYIRKKKLNSIITKKKFY